MAYRPSSVALLVLAMALTAGSQTAAQTPSTGTPTLISLDGSSAYPNGTFAEQLSSASNSGTGPVGGTGHRTGPGRRDDWLVGPRWQVTVDGLLLFRDDTDLDAILGEVAPLPPSTVLPPLEYRDNFDHAAGVRIVGTSEFPQCEGYELQLGYLGAEKWLAGALYELETLPAASLPDSDVDVFQRRQVQYESTLHALELNFQRSTRGYLKPFAGVRYLSLDESIDDTNEQFTTVILGDPTVVGDSLSSATRQTRNAVEIQNNLIGFQGGLRLDMWRPTRKVHFNGFLSTGIFCNIVDRDRILRETTSITTNELVSVPGTGGGAATEEVQTTTNSLTAGSTASTDGTRVAFVTEAALAGVWRLNESTALRGGYQVLYVHGVELADRLWTAPPPISPNADDLFLHGWFAGLEYRR